MFGDGLSARYGVHQPGASSGILQDGFAGPFAVLFARDEHEIELSSGFCLNSISLLFLSCSVFCSLVRISFFPLHLFFLLEAQGLPKRPLYNPYPEKNGSGSRFPIPGGGSPDKKPALAEDKKEEKK